MKAPIPLLIAAFLGFSPMWGQSSDPLHTTMCDLYQQPDKYNGKSVIVRARVAGNDFWIDAFTQQPCPAWTKVVIMLPANRDELIRDNNFQTLFDDLRKGRGVEATFEGRFDVIFVWKDKKRLFAGAQRKGYGKKHDAGARIVLHRVSKVESLLGSRR